jgi:hypothetical protein
VSKQLFKSKKGNLEDALVIYTIAAFQEGRPIVRMPMIAN